jgi:hypothetical protein
MAATVVCNYNETTGFTRRGPGLLSVFMNGRVHHHMRIASSTSQNCGISYFIFDDIASLAGSAAAGRKNMSEKRTDSIYVMNIITFNFT